MAGSRGGRAALAALWRIGRGLPRGEPAQARAPAGGHPRRRGDRALQLAAGATFLAHPDWTLRAMVSRDGETRDTRVIFQVYYYKGIRF